MSEPIKPRIDFDEPLQPPQEPALRAGVAFDAEQAESFFPAAPELQQEEEEGRAEGIINRPGYPPSGRCWPFAG